MLKMGVKVIFLFCALMGIPFLNSTLAKCPYKIYSIQGQIVNNENTSIEHALVVTFFDEESFGCSEFTSATGTYEIRCIYDTYKRTSFFSGDICGKTPALITIIVYAEDYDPKRITLKAEKVQPRDDAKTFRMPPIVLHRNPSQ